MWEHNYVYLILYIIIQLYKNVTQKLNLNKTTNAQSGVSWYR